MDRRSDFTRTNRCARNGARAIDRSTSGLIAPRIFCTYFDHRYLARGLALHRSLLAHCRDVCLWILCLDRECYETLSDLRLECVRLIRLEDFEADDVELHHARTNRSLVEYYFTCTPALPLYILRVDPTVESITYVDSDFYFFADPSPIFTEWEAASIGIIRHRFPAHLRHLENHGIYNVGLLFFRRDDDGLQCLQWWRERCIEWCYDRVEGGRFADQGYLNDWPARFKHVVVLEHSGVNLAPWNLSNYVIRPSGTGVLIDDVPLICFHFQGLKRRYGMLYDLGLQPYGVHPDSVVLDGMYRPYIHELRACATHLHMRADGGSRAGSSRGMRRLAPLTRGNGRGIILRTLRDVRRIALGLPRRQYVLYLRGRLV